MFKQNTVKYITRYLSFTKRCWIQCTHMLTTHLKKQVITDAAEGRGSLPDHIPDLNVVFVGLASVFTLTTVHNVYFCYAMWCRLQAFTIHTNSIPPESSAICMFRSTFTGEVHMHRCTLLLGPHGMKTPYGPTLLLGSYVGSKLLS